MENIRFKSFYDKGFSQLVLELDYKGAILSFNEAINIMPTDAHSYFLRALSKCSLGDNFGGIEDYTSAIKLRDNEIEIAYVNRGNAKLEIGDYLGAIDDYDRAIQINNLLSDAYKNRGIAHSRCNNIEKALMDYNKAIEINPKDIKSLTNRGNIKLRERHFSGAADDFLEVIKIDPLISYAYYNLAVSYHNIGLLEMALQNYDKSISIDLNFAMAYHNRAFIHMAKGNMIAAKNDFTQAKNLGLKESAQALNEYF